jgi:lipopolysaccharide/colanic/teichoic acid biosynthesis glycosyltransferase
MNSAPEEAVRASVPAIQIVPPSGQAAAPISTSPASSPAPGIKLPALAWSRPAPRRMLNFWLALALLLVLAPFMLLVALIIKLTSPGPVLYTQPRVGLDRRSPRDYRWAERRKLDYGGRVFTIYKFRTMRADVNAALQVWAHPNDERVTSVGRLLRVYRVDELPQLVNVLKRDMNIVGPRPEQPHIVMALRETIENYPLRQRVLPGITGWAQVNLSYDRCVEDARRKVEYDLEYLRNSSVTTDIRIMFRTVPVVFFKRGAW